MNKIFNIIDAFSKNNFKKYDKHILKISDNNFKISYKDFKIYIHFFDFKISSEIFYKGNLYEKILIQNSINYFYKRYFIDIIYLNIKSSSDLKILFFNSLNDEIEKILE